MVSKETKKDLTTNSSWENTTDEKESKPQSDDAIQLDVNTSPNTLQKPKIRNMKGKYHWNC